MMPYTSLNTKPCHTSMECQVGKEFVRSTPPSQEREMQTEKSKDIPDHEWGNTPDLNEWVKKAQSARADEIKAKIIPPPKTDTSAMRTVEPSDFRPANQNFAEHFNLARGLKIHDIGVNDNCIFVGLHGGMLSIDFVDKTLDIQPHREGRIIDYHTPMPEALSEVFVYKPTPESGLYACIFVVKGENQTYEYLITPSTSSLTYSFHLEFEAHHG